MVRIAVSIHNDKAIRRDIRAAAPLWHAAAGWLFPPFSADTTNSFARGWLDFSQTYREQLMLPFNLSMGVMTFFISVGIGASLGRQFNLDPVMSGLLAFMAFLLRRLGGGKPDLGAVV